MPIINQLDRAIYKTTRISRSYSQSGEDRIIQFLLANHGRSKVRYLDVGANDPRANSNTYLFYTLGGNGVCIEPNPTLADRIRKARPRDLCLNYGLGSVSEVTDFFLMSENGLSTFSKEEATYLNENTLHRIIDVIPVKVRRINDVVSEIDGEFDLVSIDVEGWNEQIVRSIDFSIWRPFCFCIETLTYAPEGFGQRLSGIIDIFIQNNYRVYADTYLNTIFVDNNSFNG